MVSRGDFPGSRMGKEVDRHCFGCLGHQKRLLILGPSAGSRRLPAASELFLASSPPVYKLHLQRHHFDVSFRQFDFCDYVFGVLGQSPITQIHLTDLQ